MRALAHSHTSLLVVCFHCFGFCFFFSCLRSVRPGKAGPRVGPDEEQGMMLEWRNGPVFQGWCLAERIMSGA